MIFPVSALTQLNSRRHCILLFNFPLKTERAVFGKEFIVKNHNSFQSGLSDVPSSENAWNSNFFRLHKIYMFMCRIGRATKTFFRTGEILRNYGISIKILLKTQAKREPRANIFEFFLLDTLKTTFWMKYSTQRWTSPSNCVSSNDYVIWEKMLCDNVILELPLECLLY